MCCFVVEVAFWSPDDVVEGVFRIWSIAELGEGFQAFFFNSLYNISDMSEMEKEEFISYAAFGAYFVGWVFGHVAFAVFDKHLCRAVRERLG